MIKKIYLNFENIMILSKSLWKYLAHSTISLFLILLYQKTLSRLQNKNILPSYIISIQYLHVFLWIKNLSPYKLIIPPLDHILHKLRITFLYNLYLMEVTVINPSPLHCPIQPKAWSHKGLYEPYFK